MRAPFQVLIFPFIKEGDKYSYAIFKRKDLGIWQGIAGGGEDNETPLEAMRREAFEEANIDPKSPFVRLSSITTIPAANICGLKWGDIIMIPEFSFGVEVKSKEFNISHEHTEYLWLSAEEAAKKLKYDSNKSAIWELDYWLKKGRLEGAEENVQSIKSFLEMDEIVVKVSALVEKDGKLLLIKEKVDERGYKWNIVKGTVDFGKDADMEAALKRELKEEAGIENYINKGITKVLVKKLDQETILQINYHVVAKELPSKENAKLEDDEDIVEYRFFDKTELCEIKKEDFLTTRAYNLARDWTN